MDGLLQWVAVLIPILGIVVGVYMANTSYEYDGLGFAIAFISLILLIFTIIAAIATYADVQSLRAFAEDTKSSYEYTICKSDSIRIVDGAVTDFSTAATIERIADFRDEVRDYNSLVRAYQAWNSVPLIGWAVASPGDLKPIYIGNEACK